MRKWSCYKNKGKIIKVNTSIYLSKDYRMNDSLYLSHNKIRLFKVRLCLVKPWNCSLELDMKVQIDIYCILSF